MEHVTQRENMIEGRGVSKVFNDFWGRPKVTALQDVDIDVSSGTIFGLLGPNGAGKSTLLKLVLGHLYPSRGALEVLGASPRSVEAKTRIGYLPERTSFYRQLTGRETLQFFGRLLGLPDAETRRRSGQLLGMMGLAIAGERRVGEYSHGMRKRLGLAQSLLNDPDLLLLDEPTAGLDPVGCREVKDLILTLGKRGKTIVMTSHLLSDVQDVCDTIMILYGGHVQAHGSIGDLLAEEDRIQIRTKAVPEDVLQAVKELLTPANPEGTLEVSAPTRTLEDYFLDVVAEADRAEQSTSGAEMGDGVAEYLKDGLDEGALESLTHRRVPSVPREPVDAVDEGALERMRKSEAPAKEEQRSVDEDALSSLVRKK